MVVQWADLIVGLTARPTHAELSNVLDRSLVSRRSMAARPWWRLRLPWFGTPPQLLAAVEERRLPLPEGDFDTATLRVGRPDGNGLQLVPVIGPYPAPHLLALLALGGLGRVNVGVGLVVPRS